MNPKRYLLLAVVSALLASGLTFDLLARVQRTVPVVVAAGQIGRYQKIEADDIRVLALPVKAAHAKAAVAREQVVGKFALEAFVAGEQILTVEVSGDAGDGSFLSRLAPNQRAFLVPSSLARAAGGAVRVGDRVDIIFVASEQKTGTNCSRTVARGLEVLDIRDERGSSAKPGAGDALPVGVIVAVTEAEARVIALAAEDGLLYLAIDGYEPAWTEDSGITTEDLVGGT
ncbi:MAG TPA: Flp pilus assembly protein CpaB [Bacillota bacterium]